MSFLCWGYVFFDILWGDLCSLEGYYHNYYSIMSIVVLLVIVQLVYWEHNRGFASQFQDRGDLILIEKHRWLVHLKIFFILEPHKYNCPINIQKLSKKSTNDRWSSVIQALDRSRWMSFQKVHLWVHAIRSVTLSYIPSYISWLHLLRIDTHDWYIKLCENWKAWKFCIWLDIGVVLTLLFIGTSYKNNLKLIRCNLKGLKWLN